MSAKCSAKNIITVTTGEIAEILGLSKRHACGSVCDDCKTWYCYSCAYKGKGSPICPQCKSTYVTRNTSWGMYKNNN